jgi:hypothetical protein
MSQMKTMTRLTLVALVAGALTLPGLALADGRGKHGHRHHDHGWHGHRHGHRGYDRDLVVIRKPVYVQPRVVVREPVYVRPRATVVAPLWQPAGPGLSLFLPLQNW